MMDQITNFSVPIDYVVCGFAALIGLVVIRRYIRSPIRILTTSGYIVEFRRTKNHLVTEILFGKEGKEFERWGQINNETYRFATPGNHGYKLDIIRASTKYGKIDVTTCYSYGHARKCATNALLNDIEEYQKNTPDDIQEDKRWGESSLTGER